MGVLNNPRFWRLLLACFWLSLFALSHLPPRRAVPGVAHYDKLLHAAAFAVLAWLLAVTWKTSAGELSFAQLGWAWLVVLLYGCFDEWSQGFVGREPSFWDWVADAIGAAAGLALFAAACRWYRR
jgi:VanZ family protein